MDPQALEHRITQIADVLAEVLAPGQDPAALGVEVLKTTDVAATVRLTAGERTGIAKLFNETAAEAFHRERKALEGFQKGLVPRLLFVSETDRLILMSEIRGKPLSDGLTAETLVQRAEFLGQWFGRIANVAPTEARPDTWYTYLKQYDTGIDQSVVDAQKTVLSQQPVNLFILSHNDNSLANFVIGKDRRLYGLDFADARMKPEGWDLVMAARAFFTRFPGDLPTIANSLIRDYALTRNGRRFEPQFDAVIATVVTATFVASA